MTLARSHGLCMSDSLLCQNARAPAGDEDLFEFQQVSNSDVHNVIMSMSPNKVPGAL